MTKDLATGAAPRLPKWLAPALAALASALTFVVFVGTPATAAGVGDCNPEAAWPANRQDYADEVIRLVNQHRATLSRVALKVSPTLTKAAVWKARHMAYYRYMEHDDPAPPIARTWYQRVQACGYAGGGAGENIAYGYTSPQSVVNAWLNSSGHRANIENSSYRVIGVGAAGTSSIAWAQNFGTFDDSGTPSDATAPSTPTALTATATSASQVSLRWNPSTDNVGVSGYRVYRGTTLLGSTTATSYTDNSAAPSTTYSYTVRAYDAAGNTSLASAAASVTTPASTPSPTDTTAPSVPSGLTATATSATQVSLHWNASTDNVGVSGYRVYRGTTLLGSTTSTSYTDSSAAPSTTYSYTVRAYDAAGNTSLASTAASVTTPASPPPPPGGTTTTVSAPYYVIQTGTLRAGTAAALAAADGSTLDVNASTTYRAAAWYGRLSARNNLTSLTVKYTGSASAACTQTVALYNWATYTWTILSTLTAGTTATTVTANASGTLANYVSGTGATGEVRVRIRCTRTDSTAFYTRGDLLTITYTTP